jgi:membrane fusion protein (multidrug efflux system)
MPLRIRRSPPRSLAPVAGALVALATLSACSKKEETKAPAPEVQVAEVIQRDMPIGAELTGTLKGYEDIEIRARVEGFLKSVNYQEGSMVKKGQLLFTIDDQPLRAKLAEAKGDLARAESTLSKATLDVRRYKPLVSQRAISQAELDNAVALQRSAQAQVDAARANVENATINLGYTRITSPIDGLAGQAQRKVGDLVGKADPTLLTVVSSINPIRVSVNLPEALYLRYASKLPAPGGAKPPKPSNDRPGAELVLGDGSLYPERGWLLFVDRSVDPTTGTVHADLGFLNPERILRPGLYAKVLYRAEIRPGALLVPQRAVTELQGQFSVAVVNADGKVESRKVKPGPRAGSLWILDEGVKPGEKVVVEGTAKVRDGMMVKATVVPAESGEPVAESATAGGAAQGGAAAGGTASGGAPSGGGAAGGPGSAGADGPAGKPAPGSGKQPEPAPPAR